MSDRILHSALSQAKVVNGHTFLVMIYRRGDDPWTYKIVNENGAARESFEPYPSAKEALNAALDAFKRKPLQDFLR